MTLARPTLVLASLAAVAAAQPLAAQARDERVAKAMFAQANGQLTSPLCDARKVPNAKVADAQKQLEKAVKEKDAAKRPAFVEAGLNSVKEAIGKGENTASGWYYLGRLSLFAGDVTTADQALTKAQAAAANCELEIEQLRRIAWVDLVNAGSDASKVNDQENALRLFREANTIYRGLYQGFLGTAVIFLQRGTDDSAEVYLTKAITIAETDTAAATRQQVKALRGNLAVVQQRQGKNELAVENFRLLLKGDPKDGDAKRGLAQAFAALKQADSAAFYEKAVAEDIAALGAGAETGDLMAAGVSMFNGKKYADAAALFGKVTEREPYNRDAIYNITNAWLAAADWPKLIEAAKRLRTIEPVSEEALQLLGNGYKQKGDQDNLITVASAIYSLPTDIKFKSFTSNAAGATWNATARGRTPKNPENGNPLPPQALELTVDFLGKDGSVVTSQKVAVNALKPDETQELSVSAKGAGIGAFRYKRTDANAPAELVEAAASAAAEKPAAPANAPASTMKPAPKAPARKR